MNGYFSLQLLDLYNIGQNIPYFTYGMGFKKRNIAKITQNSQAEKLIFQFTKSNKFFIRIFCLHDEDLNSFASPSDMMMTPHCYPPPSSLMHGGYPSGPQPCVHDFQYQYQGPQLHGYTPHDLQVLARIRNRPVVCFCHRNLFY